MNAFINSLKGTLKNGSSLTKLLYLNVGVFVVLKLSLVILLVKLNMLLLMQSLKRVFLCILITTLKRNNSTTSKSL